MRRNAILILILALAWGCEANLLLENYKSISPQADSRPLAVLRRGFWVVGGQTDTYTGTNFPFAANLPAQIDVFDPVTETWLTNVTQLPVPVSFAGVAGYKGKLYVVGGWDKQGAVQQMLQIYDLVSDTWTIGASFPVLRAGFDLMPIENDYLFATSGYNTNIDGAYNNQNQWYMYHIPTNTWFARLAYGFPEMSSITLRGAIHTVGGRTAAATLVNTHDAYLPWPTFSNDGATSATGEIAAPTVRLGGALTVVNHSSGMPLLVLLGGMNANPTGTPLAYIFRNIASGTLTNQFHFLPPPYELGTWTTPTATLGVSLMYAQALSYGNLIYVFGGSSSVSPPSVLNQVHKINFNNPLSIPPPTTVTPMPVGRFGHKVVMINGFSEEGN